MDRNLISTQHLHRPANLSFAAKQRIFCLVVDRIEVTDEQSTIKHVILISDARLQRHHHAGNTSISARLAIVSSLLLSWSPRCPAGVAVQIIDRSHGEVSLSVRYAANP